LLCAGARLRASGNTKTLSDSKMKRSELVLVVSVSTLTVDRLDRNHQPSAQETIRQSTQQKSTRGSHERPNRRRYHPVHSGQPPSHSMLPLGQLEQSGIHDAVLVPPGYRQRPPARCRGRFTDGFSPASNSSTIDMRRHRLYISAQIPLTGRIRL
jgi:hypothetical protein